MNWEAISAIGQLIGAIAVIITLIYLSIQMKQNTEAVATSTYESTMTGFNDINVVVASTPELASILNRGYMNTNELTKIETVQFNSYYVVTPINGGNYINFMKEVAFQEMNGQSLPKKQHNF